MSDSNILLICKGETKNHYTVGGFVWRYEGDSFQREGENYEKERSYSNKPRPVVQYTKKGIKIKEHESAKKAKKETGVDDSSITKNCRGKYKSAGGYVWEYA